MTKDEQHVLDEKYGGDSRAAGFPEDCRRLAAGEPVAYVIGWQPFLGQRIFLDSKPLIPRPETEWWTEQLLDEVTTRASVAAAFLERTDAPLRFLDLCAGSGAIGCATLARLPQARVHFGEIDPAHGATILKNVRENALDESRADIRIGDLFEPFADMRFDIIAANPPYIPLDRDLPESVARHEPGLALFAGADGLALIRRIAEQLPARLNTGGFAWIECDRFHAAAACALFEARGLRTQMRTDQYDVPRVIVVSLPA